MFLIILRMRRWIYLKHDDLSFHMTVPKLGERLGFSSCVDRRRSSQCGPAARRNGRPARWAPLPGLPNRSGRLHRPHPRRRWRAAFLRPRHLPQRFCRRRGAERRRRRKQPDGALECKFGSTIQLLSRNSARNRFVPTSFDEVGAVCAYHALALTHTRRVTSPRRRDAGCCRSSARRATTSSTGRASSARWVTRLPVAAPAAVLGESARPGERARARVRGLCFFASCPRADSYVQLPKCDS